MVYVFICVDFDRDYAYPVKNIQHAVSKPILLKSSNKLLIDPVKSLSIQGTTNCFEPFITYLLDRKLHSTFYFEARTTKVFLQEVSESTNMFKQPFFEFGVHGYDHEDLTGEDTGFRLSKKDETAVIKKAKEELKDTNEIDAVNKVRKSVFHYKLDFEKEDIRRFYKVMKNEKIRREWPLKV